MKNLARIAVFAENTFREAVRDKLLYNLLIFAALMIASSVVLAKLHIGYDERIYRDVGLATIAFFGALIAIFVGINLVYREISLQTVYAMLAKPVHRWEFLVGKYLGLVALLAVEVVLMAGFFFAVLWIKGSPATLGLFWAVELIFLELALITAIALFFSSFTTPYLAGMFTVALWIIGHLLGDVRAFGMQQGSEAIRPFTDFLYWTLPNLDRLDVKGPAAEGLVIPGAQVALASLYALFYSALLLCAATLLFQRRDFR
jgi:ABC-type transport system involved in multi-copper enzyme maturation permease subunit